VSAENPREIALRLLQRGVGGDFIEDRLDVALAQSRLASADRHLCQALVYGIIRWQATLDWLISRKTDTRAQRRKLQNLLRLGLYQVFWMDRIPNHAAVHEAVELAKRCGHNTQAGFINAILRGYLREFDATKRLLAELKTTEPYLGYSHPQWLGVRWQKRWGADRAAQLMEWNNTPPKIFVRINTLKADPGKLLPQWRDEDVDYDFFRRDWIEEHLVFELRSHPPLHRLPSFQQGAFYVQDPSTLLAVHELDPQPGERILDLCAAPGGKLTAIAQFMRNEGTLFAHDRTAERLQLIAENCARLGVTCVLPFSASLLNPQLSTSFDRILIDAPCSNTGVMRRRVDLRWRIRPEEIARLRAVQLDLLRQAAPLLKPGGVLVYSTCSLEPEENSALGIDFLNQWPDFRFERDQELLPFVDGVDGAYVAKLAKTSKS